MEGPAAENGVAAVELPVVALAVVRVVELVVAAAAELVVAEQLAVAAHVAVAEHVVGLVVAVELDVAVAVVEACSLEISGPYLHNAGFERVWQPADAVLSSAVVQLQLTGVGTAVVAVLATELIVLG